MNADVIIIGGGLSGLVNAIVLAQKGWKTIVFEKHSYPFHKVCGEYVSTEVLPFLTQISCNPTLEFQLPQINSLTISSTSGKTVTVPLESGAFGISRYSFDAYLYRKAMDAGADVRTNTTVTGTGFEGEMGWVKIKSGETFHAPLIIGAFGKHSNIDRLLERPFFQKKSDYIGIKHHFNFTIEPNKVFLHNFKHGYAGVSTVEDGIVNVCYLTTQRHLKDYGSVASMEQHVLLQNPFLKEIFTKGTKRFEEPKAISQVSFEPKRAVEDHILMSGDSAGLIAPLSGNGMAMAIHAARVCSELCDEFLQKKISRSELEDAYERRWTNLFYRRLRTGKQLQALFGHSTTSELSLQFFRMFPGMLKKVIRRTHGKAFA